MAKRIGDHMDICEYWKLFNFLCIPNNFSELLQEPLFFFNFL